MTPMSPTIINLSEAQPSNHQRRIKALLLAAATTGLTYVITDWLTSL